MTSHPGDPESLDAIRRAAATLLPELTKRLSEHGLGEIEVRHGGVRLRVRADPAGPRSGASAPAAADTEPSSDDAAGDVPAEHAAASVVSPAVGIFVYGQGLGPGLTVSAGDSLGHVEMLGVQYDVRAPDGGRVSHLVAETGEAVEYGQVLIELEPEPAP